MHNKKATHGGARKGAGRKPKEKTVVLSFRVPQIIAKEIKAIISQMIKNYDRN